MEIKKLNGAISGDTAEEVKKVYGSLLNGGPFVIELWSRLRKVELGLIKGMFNENELRYMADMLNSHLLGNNYVDIAIDSFVFNIQEADRYGQLGEKCPVNLELMIEKVKKLTPSQWFYLREFIKEALNSGELLKYLKKQL